MSQYNINRPVAARFLPDANFARSVGCWLIFLTLNKVINSPSGHLTIAAGRLYGSRPILSSNEQIFSQCPSGVPTAIVRTPGSHHWESCRSPKEGNESHGRLPFTYGVTGRSPAGVLPICVGFGWDSLRCKYLHRHFNLLTIITVLY